MMSMLCNCCVRELLILARTWFAFGLPSKTGCDRNELQAKAEAEAENNMKLRESLKDLQNKCSDFATRCMHRLKRIFNSVGASS
jgi:hypothetical protein